MKGGGGGRLVTEVERVGEGGGMLISFVDALTCNMGVIAQTDLRCVLPNVGFDRFACPLGVGRSKDTGVLSVEGVAGVHAI